jgi:CTP synthase (UTP-ammonia lyase)
VEGLEGTGDQFIVGVQCHPERTESTPAEFERLFAAFVEAAAKRGVTSGSQAMGVTSGFGATGETSGS